MRNILDPFALARAWQRAGETGPPVDLYETAETVIVRMAVPGADGASLSLTIAEDTVTLTGETGGPGNKWGDRTVVHWQEIPYGHFERTVPLPTTVNKNAAKAQFKNGVLDIVLPKQAPAGTRTVHINIT
ncbi:MAG TPA: Hsp20/alpha crystallin family protein [Methylomirabilota bacterium]|jgi:HSP20 family protein